MTGIAFEDVLEGIVHADTQRREDAFDLTVAKIYRLDGSGRIDFGGGELEAPTTDEVPTKKRDAGDDYGWWHLEPGTYLVEYNEWIETDLDGRLLLQPRDELLAQGAFHATVAVQEIPKMPMTVGGAGARIKENARLSTLVDL